VLDFGTSLAHTGGSPWEESMPVVAVVNRKGGTGKSTFAAHVAAWCARQQLAVMLGDIDRQQSSRGWLRRRDASLPAIAPWTIDQKNVLRVPTGITHVVLDTPGGLHGFELARIVMFADAIVLPVCPSLFDRESAAGCIDELLTLPRITKGLCKVATVGMRVDGRTSAGDVLRAWAQDKHVDMIGVLRETQLYVRSLERGLTLFDLPVDKAAADLAQWASILQWLHPVLLPAAVPEAKREPVLPVRRPSVLQGRPLHENRPLHEGGLRPSVLGSRSLNDPARALASPGRSGH
jgi:chromosome partitioning protein